MDTQSATATSATVGSRRRVEAASGQAVRGQDGRAAERSLAEPGILVDRNRRRSGGGNALARRVLLLGEVEDGGRSDGRAAVVRATPAEARAAHELHVKHDVDEARLDADDDALSGERHAAGLGDGDDAVAQRKVLLAEANRRVRGLEDALARDVVDASLLDLVERLGRRELVFELLDQLDSVLRRR